MCSDIAHLPDVVRYYRPELINILSNSKYMDIDQNVHSIYSVVSSQRGYMAIFSNLLLYFHVGLNRHNKIRFLVLKFKQL